MIRIGSPVLNPRDAFGTSTAFLEHLQPGFVRLTDHRILVKIREVDLRLSNRPL